MSIWSDRLECCGNPTIILRGFMGKMRLCFRFFLVSVLVLTSLAMAVTRPDPPLEKAYRFQQGGWTYVHLEGTPSEIGYQHGYLLAPEIQDAFEAVRLFDTHQSQHDWEFF